MPLYPLVLDPIYKDKVWGGRTLETLGRTLPGADTNLIGESWELADLAATSPSGGGGAAAYSKILNGPLNKRALGEVMKEFGPFVTGAAMLQPDGSFPLLLKYLDATKNLSIQVHPSVEFVSDNPDSHLKSEAWYIVAAEPDAVIYKGVKAGTTRDVFAAAIEEGTVEELMISVPAVAGDCHYLPSGTCHALGGGILAAEVQTPSDTTFRVFDWGRTDRELHVEAALSCIDYGPVETSAFEPGTVSERDDATGRDLVVCEHFSIREWTIPKAGRLTLESDAVAVLMLLSGEAEVRWGEDQAQALRARAGNTIVLPAALAAVTLEASAAATLLEITIPSEETSV